MVSDEALLERLLHGDLGAFDSLYERHERPLFAFVLRMLGNRADAEEVLHDVFLTLLRERRSDRPVRAVRPWLYEVARNQCLNRLRSRRRASLAVDSAAREPVDAVPPPDVGLAAHEKTAALSAAVARLPPALAELYTLRARGLSYEELAARLAVPIGTVKSRMHEMVTRLREEMRDELQSDRA